MPYPFTSKYRDGAFGLGPEHGRRYYGPSLSDPRSQPSLWTSRESRDFYEDQHGSSGFIYAGAGLAGLAALGRVKVPISEGAGSGFLRRTWRSIPSRALWGPRWRRRLFPAPATLTWNPSCGSFCPGLI